MCEGGRGCGGGQRASGLAMVALVSAVSLVSLVSAAVCCCPRAIAIASIPTRPTHTHTLRSTHRSHHNPNGMLIAHRSLSVVSTYSSLVGADGRGAGARVAGGRRPGRHHDAGARRLGSVGTRARERASRTASWVVADDRCWCCVGFRRRASWRAAPPRRPCCTCCRTSTAS